MTQTRSEIGYSWDDFCLKESRKIFGTKLVFIHPTFVRVLKPKFGATMNAKIFPLIISLSFLGRPASHASVTSIPTWSYSGGIYCYGPVLSTDSGTGAQSVAINGTQSGPGSMGISILTDTPSDPTNKIN
jgi:hypothetical protein